MVRVFTSTMALLCVLGSVGNLMAQDLNAMNNAFNQQMNARMNQQLSGIIQTNMQDPRVQQMYRMHRAQGGTLDFPSYCYQYALTAGLRGKVFKTPSIPIVPSNAANKIT